MRNDAILNHLAEHRRNEWSLFIRLLFNKYTLVGAPIVAGVMNFLYHDELAPIFNTLTGGMSSLLSGTFRSSDLYKFLALHTQGLQSFGVVRHAQVLFRVARNERQRILKTLRR